jgi:hypothetical protein
MVAQATPEQMPIWTAHSERMRVQRFWLGVRRHLRGLQGEIFTEFGRENSMLSEAAWVLGLISRGIEERYGLAPRRKSLE